jgi:hypothetical protein
MFRVYCGLENNVFRKCVYKTLCSANVLFRKCSFEKYFILKTLGTGNIMFGTYFV